VSESGVSIMLVSSLYSALLEIYTATEKNRRSKTILQNGCAFVSLAHKVYNQVMIGHAQ